MSIAAIARNLSVKLLPIVLTAVLGGLLGATLVRMAPGFGVQDSDLNAHLSAEARAASHRQSEAERNIGSYYLHFLAALAHGDLGYSRSLNRPITELLRDRVPQTVVSVLVGVLGGWSLGLGLALPLTWKSSPLYGAATTILSGLCLCIPSAVAAVVLMAFGSAGRLAIALVVFPKVFRYSRNLLEKTYSMPHVLTAYARGLSTWRVLSWHVLPAIAGPLLALAGVTVSIALGAAIPVEAVCDTPGLGQLAWRAALSRDVPLLVTVTLIIALVTVTANVFADSLLPRTRTEEA